MRWDRLFDELEAHGSDLELEERDALVDELRDGDWAETTWRSMLGGQVSIEVRSVGRVDGEVVIVNDRLLQLRGDLVDVLVNVEAVVAVHASERRADTPSAVGSALGWGHAFRALRDAGETVVVRMLDGTIRDGAVDVVGRDFVRLGGDSGRTQILPFAGLVLVSGRT